MKVIPQLAIVIVVAGAAAGAWYWYGDQQTAATKAATKGGARPIAVQVAPARRETVTSTVEAVGTAQANEAVTITSKVSALVTKIHFNEGAAVSAGDILAELDASELRAALGEKRAQWQQAKRLYDRAILLYQSRNVSEARVDELKAALDASAARVQADEARLEDFIIRAPFAGRLGLRRVSVGALVNPTSVITTLDDTAKIKIDFRVPEAVLALAKPGLAIQAESASYANRKFQGVVRTVDTRVDQATRSVELRTEFANGDGALKPGMFLTAKLSIATRPDAIVVPEESIVTQGADHFVFAVRDGKAIRTKLVIGERLVGAVEVMQGLKEGDLVVVQGLQKIRDGAPVQPERAGQPRSANTSS
jgi:membrane fusion protein (multidrug efflux system)